MTTILTDWTKLTATISALLVCFILASRMSYLTLGHQQINIPTLLVIFFTMIVLTILMRLTSTLLTWVYQSLIVALLWLGTIFLILTQNPSPQIAHAYLLAIGAGVIGNMVGISFMPSVWRLVDRIRPTPEPGGSP